MLHQFSRNELAIGKKGIKKLEEATVAILGVGGVGSFAAEALIRSGVGHIVLVDKDHIDVTNINRQIHALLSTVGRSKVETMKERMMDINPACEVTALQMFYTEHTYERFFSHQLDYIIDASDTITYKIHLIKESLKRNIPMISSMGAANKMDPTRFQIADIFQTHTDPIAKVIRTRLRKEGIKRGVPVVFSDESPIVIREDIRREVGDDEAEIRKAKMPPSSNAFVPTTAGLIMASYVVKELLKDIKIDRVNDAK
ncbi:tRNA threonylcarbamoyladenosine dehydratase [Bacillus chungangensis]|uniref:tRNA A37 threonylcarbamoyladenosine dehydratase n=1 Tax=Bacillus chungangensis TaxID=587633 RepID=A0ABT9WLW0_9BACI|nr:tRNA threonylcarbamoyladenosine dehydratase [Bacillus chungangensis]MDQ0174277.1 tRNA A37 threonylcarbamoyladenosine dehydratase [Bacillus chungangensis]